MIVCFVHTNCGLTPPKHHSCVQIVHIWNLFDELNNMVAQKSREKQKRGMLMVSAERKRTMAKNRVQKYGKEEILKWFDSDNSNSIYGYMYGAPYVYSCGIEKSEWRRDKLIEIKKSELRLGVNKDCFVFIWGWPGPDFNIYEFSDYGVTWAFSESEVDTGYVMEKQGNAWKLVKNNYV